jgi:hypothetical protein
MSLSQEQINISPFPLIDYSAELVNVPATATIFKRIRVPRACVLERMDAVYETEAGTGPAVTVELRKGTTVLFSVALTTNATMLSDITIAANQSLLRDTGEELNLALTAANADNDFAGFSCQVWATHRLV